MKKFALIIISVICAIACAIGFAACGEKEMFVYEEVEGFGYVVRAANTDLEGDIIVPATYNGKTVYAIGGNAFKDCKKIDKVILPEGITSIWNYAFENCSVKTVTLPKSLKSIMDLAFPRNNSSIYRIDYMGTIAEWKKIDGYTFISSYVHIVCTDGEWER